MMAGTVAGGIAGIVVALGGYGAWAIIGQQLAIAFVSTTLLGPSRRGAPPSRSPADLRELGGLARASSAHASFSTSTGSSTTLIGRFLGASALGAYAVAYNVMLMPLSRIAQPIVEVLFPAMSQIEHHRPRMAAMWVRANRMIGAITIPAMVGLIIVAPEFVATLFGERGRARPVIQILAWVGLLQSVQRLIDVLMATDRAGTLLRYSVVVLVASVVAFVVGIQWGIVGVAAGYAISSTLVSRTTPGYREGSRVAVARPHPLARRRRSGDGRDRRGRPRREALAGVAGPAGRRPAPDLRRSRTGTYLALAAWRAPKLRADVRGLRRARSAPAPQPA